MRFTSYKRVIFSLFSSFLLIGIFFGYTSKVSLFPDSEKPLVRISFEHDFDITALIDSKIPRLERALRGLQGVNEILGSYSSNQVVIDVVFRWNTPITNAINEVTKATSAFQSELPDHYKTISVKYLDPGIELYAAITSETLSEKELVDYLKQNIQPQIDSLEGIASSFVLDPLAEELMIKIDPYKLYNYQISLSAVIEALKDSRFDINIGKISKNNHSDIAFSLSRSSTTIEDLASLTVGVYQQHVVKLNDIAELYYHNSNSARLLLVDSKAAITVAAWPYPDTNIYRTSILFEQLLSDKLKGIADFKINNSPKSYIKDAIEEMFIAVCLGIIFSFLSVLILMRKLSLSLITSVAMPVALIMSLGSFSLFGVNINILSIAATSVSIGIVIDNCVLVINRILRSSQSPSAIKNSVLQCLPDLLLTSLTTIIVFLPILFTEASIKALFGDFCLVICLMVTASLIIAIFLIPVLVNYFKFDNVTTEQLDRHYGYGFFVNIYCRFRFLSVAFLFCTVTFSIYSMLDIGQKLRKEIVAQPLPKIIDIGMVFHSNELTTETRKKLVSELAQSAQQQYSNYISYTVEDIRKNFAYISLFLKSYKDADFMLQKMRKEYPSTEAFDIDIQPWVSASLKSTNYPDFRLFINKGSHIDSSQTLNAVLKQVKAEVQVKRAIAKPRHLQQTKLTYRVKDDAVANLFDSEFFLKKEDIERYLQYSLTGSTLFSLNDGIRKIPVKIKIEHHKSGIPLSFGENQVLSLSDFIDKKLTTNYDKYARINGVNQYYIDIWLVDGSDYRKAKNSIQQVVEEHVQNLSEYYLEPNQQINASIKSLGLAMIASILLIFLILYVAYGSWYVAVISFVPFPLMVASAVYALHYFDSSLSVNSIIGFMLLLGVFVNHHIVVFRDFFDKSDFPLNQAITEACSDRFRIILISCFSTIFGALPLAFDTGTSTPIMQPLGIVLISGFTISVISMYIFTPILMLILPRSNFSDDKYIELNQKVVL